MLWLWENALFAILVPLYSVDSQIIKKGVKSARARQLSLIQQAYLATQNMVCPPHNLWMLSFLLLHHKLHFLSSCQTSHGINSYQAMVSSQVLFWLPKWYAWYFFRSLAFIFICISAFSFSIFTIFMLTCLLRGTCSK